MHTLSRRRPASPPRRARPCLEALEDRELLAAALTVYPAAALPTDPSASTNPAVEQDEYATAPSTPVATPARSQTTAGSTSTGSASTYDQYDWVRAARSASANTAASGQSNTDVGTVADAVRAQHKESGQPDLLPLAVHGAREGTSGNDVLVLPGPGSAVVLGAGVGAASVVPSEIQPDDTTLAGVVPPERLSAGAIPGGLESAAAQLDDLPPHLAPVLVGDFLSGPREIADLGGRIGNFFSQLRALENPFGDADAPLGLAPWVVAVAVSAAAVEYGRRRLRRSPTEGPAARPPSWVRRGGGHLLTAEELQ
jgi:hypothetical protein